MVVRCASHANLFVLVAQGNFDPFGSLSAIWAVGLIAAGLIITFSGKRFFKILLAASGFVAGLIISVNILSGMEYLLSFCNFSQTIYLAIGISIGLILAAVCFILWEVGVLVAAGYGGYALACWVLSLKEGGLVQNFLTRELFIAVVSAVAVVLAWFFSDLAIVATSAFGGAMTLVFGADILLNWGLAAMIMNFLIPKFYPPAKDLDILFYIQIAAVLGLAIIGATFQLLFTKKGGISRSDKV